MRQFILRRLLFIVLVLLLVSILVFFITSIIPGDTAQAMLGQNATPESLKALRHTLGLDQPPIQRYFPGWGIC